jgi:hypothetical protein
MGVVYRARQLQPERLVALKVIRTDRLEDLPAGERRRWIDRFRREAQLVATLDQPGHIVTLYEVGEHQGQPYFTMRLVEGGSLGQRLRDLRAADPASLPSRRVRQQRANATLLAQAARAVEYAHQHGILHRDLKPDNILLDNGRPLVTDFGLARRLDETGSLVASGIEGTAAYMAPEQATGAKGAVTRAADVYSLGAILYELLTGQPPFRGKNDVETLLLVLKQEPIAPRRLEPRLSRDLETICLKCLNKEPGGRYRSAEALAEDLERWLAGRPIQARPVGLPGKLWRWCRRNPILAALSAAALILIALVGAVYWQYRSTAASATIAGEQLQKRDVAAKQREGELINAATLVRQQAQERAAAARQREDAASYLEDMPLALRHINAGNLGEARRVLAKWKPGGGETDHRAWEWYFLDAQCREVPFAVRGHPGQVQAVAWSPDGQRLASADRQGSVRVWSLADGKDRPLFEMPVRTGSVAALAWSPDGQHLAAVCQGMVQLWEAGSGKEERSLRTADNSLSSALPATGTDAWCRQILVDTWIVSLTWSPNSHKLALIDANGKVQV